jgi:hypothetical protein
VPSTLGFATETAVLCWNSNNLPAGDVGLTVTIVALSVFILRLSSRRAPHLLLRFADKRFLRGYYCKHAVLGAALTVAAVPFLPRLILLCKPALSLHRTLLSFGD